MSRPLEPCVHLGSRSALLLEEDPEVVAGFGSLLL